jgi:prevent-host-death family protein
MPAKTMSATEFKAKCLAVMDEVKATGREIRITKHGREICRVLPLPRDQSGLWGLHEREGQILASDDELFSTGEAWEADSP